MQPSRNNTYIAPALTEVDSYDRQRHYNEALEAAANAYEVGPEVDAVSADRLHIESSSAQTAAVTEVAQPTAKPKEEFFNYSDFAQLNLVAPAMVCVRRQHIATLNLSAED